MTKYHESYIDPQKGIVISIPDVYSIVINIGSEDGLKIGSKVQVFEKGYDVFNPGESTPLGRVDFVKDTLEVVDLYPKYSIAKKKVKKNKTSSMALLIAGATIESVEKIDVDESQVRHADINNPVITVGDAVKVID